MKVKYIGESFGIEGLTNERIYDVIAIEDNMLRIIDDSGEDYLYSVTTPCSLEDNSKCGKWEIVEDNEKEDLEKVIFIQSIIQEYGYTIKQAIEMYEAFKKVKEKSNL